MENLVKFEEATNRNTKCYWVTALGVSILFSYNTPMAVLGGGHAFRREDGISRTTRKHLREAGVDMYSKVPDGEFERRMNTVILGQVLKDKKVLEQAVAAAVTMKLVPETADGLG